MRKIGLIAAGISVIGLAVVIGGVAFALRELGDPTSGTSVSFTSGFIEKCKTAAVAGKHDVSTQQSAADGAQDNIDELCRCGADNLREDLAESGIMGLAHMILVEGIDAKMQRLMDACQTTPSAP